MENTLMTKWCYETMEMKNLGKNEGQFYINLIYQQ